MPTRRKRKLNFKQKFKNKYKIFKEYTIKIFKEFTNLSKVAAYYSIYSFSILAFLLGIVYLSAKAPQWHEDYLNIKLGHSVVMLTPVNNMSTGGTGFQMKTNKGLRIITNEHICKSDKKTGYLLATTEGFQQIIKILKIDSKADLCMLEGVDLLPGLKIADRPNMGDTIGIVGHPLLQPQTFSKGRILARQGINVITGLYNERTCIGPGARPVFGNAYCARFYMSYYTNAIIFPGNSGSPAVNFWGNVVGVVFAGNGRTNYGYLVPYEDLKRFINE